MKRGLLLLAIALLAPACKKSHHTSDAEGQHELDLRLTSGPNITHESGLTFLTGEVVNRGGGLHLASITIRLFDSAGRHIGNAIDTISNLDSGAVWRFKALAAEDSFARFEVSELTGFRF